MTRIREEEDQANLMLIFTALGL